ncbi:hypothetical protein PR202_gb15063 [Eleusine coracana subsp. coracana]|uniref:Uncharacterized protein n=1 Tax=Eleusine coracana subsp. coracana TaxID=191504 RepID=A0AAV5EYF5_ELECO|nr:hypothetical protein PR202_gb15063 [Eleusine coracana subsp. coracana]
MASTSAPAIADRVAPATRRRVVRTRALVRRAAGGGVAVLGRGEGRRRRWAGLRARCGSGGGQSPAVQPGSQNSGKGLMAEGGEQRPPFDLNLAVVLAGFAFEAYTSPPADVGWRETDAAECQTVFLSDVFLREVYDGQLVVKLKKGINLPALDPWVAAWDANLVTPHKRMGNSGLYLESLCDGNYLY